MAQIEVGGLEGLEDALGRITDIPEAVIMDMLHAEADVVVKAQKEQIDSLGLRDTGQLRESIARSGSTGGGRPYLDIYPQGTREDGRRNAEVGFIHEFGAPGRHIRASGWMESANEKCAEEAVEAAAEVYNQLLDRNNL